MFELSKVKGTIEGVSFRKAKPGKNAGSGAPAGAKKLSPWCDVGDAKVLKRLEPLFPGCVVMVNETAKEHAPGFELRAKRKMGKCAVTVDDAATGRDLFAAPTARVGQPRLVVTAEAKSSWLILDVELPIAREKLGNLDDYFKADVLVSCAQSQLDVEDEAKKGKRERAEDAEVSERKAKGVRG